MLEVLSDLLGIIVEILLANEAPSPAITLSKSTIVAGVPELRDKL